MGLERKKIIELLLLLLIGLLSFAFYDHYRQTKTVSNQINLSKKSEAQARYKKGPYIESESVLSANEVSKVIVYPSKLGEFFDNRCYVYANSELQSSSMTCDFNKTDVGSDYNQECYDKQGSHIC